MMRCRVVIANGHVFPLASGFPWVFASAVDRKSCVQGDELLANVYDKKGNFLFAGFHSKTDSQIVVRKISELGETDALDKDFVERKLVVAKQLRADLGIVNERTNAYRMLNSEGDGLGGVTIDVFNDVASVQFYSHSARSLISDAVFSFLAKEMRSVVEVPGKGSPEAVPHARFVTFSLRLFYFI
jgi:23S rRNA (cytosine1962-C5)-methyltransferase